jgi:hypothetical protein
VAASSAREKISGRRTFQQHRHATSTLAPRLFPKEQAHSGQRADVLWARQVLQ